MSTRDWYRFILQRDVTMTLDENNLQILKPCRIERNMPDKNWPMIWLRVRQSALHSEVVSFGWKMIHELLPTESRLSATIRNTPPLCKFKCQNSPVADLQHCLLSCNLVKDVGIWLLSMIRHHYKSQISEVDLLLLNMDLCESTIWIVLNTLQYCWSRRNLGKKATKEDCISSLLADLNILKDSEHRNVAEGAIELIAEPPPD